MALEKCRHDIYTAAVRTRSLTWLFLVIIAALFLGWRYVKQRFSARGNQEQISANPGSMHSYASSGSARVMLESVLSGLRPKPPYQDLAAYERYQRLTSKWIAELNLADCVALIDQCENKGISHSLIQDFYQRYGALDHRGALARVRSLTGKSDGVRSTLLSRILQGWAKIQPRETWLYLNQLKEEELAQDSIYDDVPFEVFRAWVNIDADQAYENLISAEGEYFLRGASGYYWGLSRDADFEKESARLEAALKQGRHLSSRFVVIGGQEWNGRDSLSAYFAAKWAMQDANAATQWWLGVLPGEGAAKSDPYWRANRLGFFVAVWAGIVLENEPDAALAWVAKNRELWQRSEFQELVIPELAKHRPVETITLLQSIDSLDRQAQLLEEMVRSPEYLNHGAKGAVLNIAALVHPDTMRPLLRHFSLSSEQADKVNNAMIQRIDYERKKPSLAPTGW